MYFLEKKYNSLSLPAKATIWFTACNFVLKGISFITGPIFTRLLSPEEYGKLSVYISYEQLFLILATWEIQLGAYQKGIFKYKDDVNNFTTASLALINLITIGCFILVFIFNRMVTRITGMPVKILFLLFLYLLFRPAYNCWLVRKRKAYNYKEGVSATLLYSLINVLVPLGALLTLNRTANIKFGATLLASSVICFLFFIKHANYWELAKDWKTTKGYWLFCISFEGPLVLHSLSYLVLSQADRVMINEMVGSNQAAFYSVAYSIASVVSLFQSSINTSLSPWRFQMLEDGKYGQIRGVTNKLLIAFAGIIILFILAVPDLVKILFPRDYYESIWCIPPISASVFFMFLYSIFVNIEEYYEQTKYVVYVSVVCGVVNIVLNYIFIGVFGYIACAYTTLFSYILFSFGHYYFMKKTIVKAGVKEDIVDAKAIIIISVVVVMLSIISTILYNYALLRFSLLIVGVVLLIIKREAIIVLLTKMKTK